MNFSKYYIAIIILCVTAGFAARYLVMSPETTALVYMDATLYEDAVKRYEALLKSGDRSGNVIIPLARLYKMNDEEKKAQALLIRYINENPDLKDPQAVLAQFSRPSIKSEEYKKIIEEAVRFPDMNGILCDLSDWYESTRQDKRQIEFFTELAKRAVSKELDSEYNKLILYYSINMKLAPTPAIRVKQILNTSARTSPKQNFMRTVCLMVNSGEYQQALKHAEQYFKAQNPLNPSDIEAVADIFLSAGQTGISMELCQNFLKGNDNLELLRICRNRIEVARGGGKKVLDDMKFYFKSGRIKHKSGEDLLRILAMKYNDSATIMEIIKRSNPKDMPSNVVYDLAFYALKSRDGTVAAALRAKIDPEELLADPCLTYVLKCASKRIAASSCAELAPNDKDMKKYDIEQLAYLMYHYDYKTEAMQLIRNSDPKVLLSIFKMTELCNLIMKTGSPYAFISRAGAGYQEGAPENNGLINDCLMLMAAGIGDKAYTEERYASEDKIPFEMLTDIYCNTTRWREYGQALKAAMKMDEFNSSDPVRYMLAEAMLKNGDPAAAMNTLTPLIGKIKMASQLFLRAYALEYSTQDKMEIPLAFDELASTEASKILESQKALPAEKQALALYLSAKGKLEEAENIYLELCRGSDPDASDISNMIKICKGDPSQPVREWLIRQAESGPWEIWQRLEWLNQAGMEKETVRIVENVYRNIELSYLPDYLAALQKLGQTYKVNEILHRYPLKTLLSLDTQAKMKMLSILPSTDNSSWTGQLLKTVSRKDIAEYLGDADIANIYISAGIEEEGLRIFASPQSRTSKDFYVNLYLRTFKGENAYVEAWIDGAGPELEEKISAVYYFAAKKNREDIMFKAAQRLYAIQENKTNRLRLAEAYLVRKNYGKVLELTNADADSDSRSGSIYLEAVAALASEGLINQDSPELPRMLKICTKIVSDPKAPDALKINAAYALSNTGHHDLAKQIFYGFAMKNPSVKNDLTRMYFYSTVMSPERQDYKNINALVEKVNADEEAPLIQLLETYGMLGQIMMLIEKRYGLNVPVHLYPMYLNCLLKCRKLKTLDQITAHMPEAASFTDQEKTDMFTTLMLAGRDSVAARFYNALSDNAASDVQQALVRRLGYYYANKGDYKDAIPLFFALAKQNPVPDSTDVGILMSFPGTTESKPVIDWFISQAKNTKDETQLRWLEILNITKHPDAVIDIIEESGIE